MYLYIFLAIIIYLVLVKAIDVIAQFKGIELNQTFTFLGNDLSIQELLALVIIIGFVGLAVYNNQAEVLKDPALLILGFYFGAQTTKK